MGQKVKIVQDVVARLDKVFAICEHIDVMIVPLTRGSGLRVIAKRRLIELARELSVKYGDCESQVIHWYNIASKATWHDLSEVRQAFRHADIVGDKTVFNIKGNEYRLIVQIVYTTQTIYIRDLLTHKEYDKGNWKK